MLTMFEPYMILEEKLTTRLDNPSSIEYHLSFPFGKESHRHHDDFDKRLWGNMTGIRSPERKFIRNMQILNSRKGESELFTLLKRHPRQINQSITAYTKVTIITLMIVSI